MYFTRYSVVPTHSFIEVNYLIFFHMVLLKICFTEILNFSLHKRGINSCFMSNQIENIE